jgi:hypothetical protein
MGQSALGAALWIGLPTSIAVFMFWKARRWHQRGLAPLLQGLAAANSEHGTAFPTNGAKSNLVLGDLTFPIDCCLMFDTTKRKVAVLTHSRFELHDISYVRAWELRWVDTSVGTSTRRTKFKFIISTTDIDRPSLEIPVFSEKEAQDWFNRLPLLLGT